jgi:hypothetical protein
MGTFVGFFLGYLTCYLELAGHTWGSRAAGLTAAGLAGLRLLGYTVMQPLSNQVKGYAMRRLMKWRYFVHHFEHHPSFSRHHCSRCN